MKALTRLVADRNVKAMVKMFVTSANRAMSVSEFFKEGDRVWVPETPLGARLGFSDSHFQSAFGKKISTLEDRSQGGCTNRY